MDAKRHCNLLNGRLMEVRTQEEFDLVKRFKMELLRNSIWLGGSDREIEGEWRWESNAELIDMNKFWESGEPNDQNSSEDCLVLGNHEFNDQDCSKTRVSVCELD